jgi:hypothetical protein
MTRMLVQLETNFWSHSAVEFHPNDEISAQSQWTIKRYYVKKHIIELPSKISMQDCANTGKQNLIVLHNIKAHLDRKEVSLNSLGFWNGSVSWQRKNDVLRYFIALVDVQFLINENSRKIALFTQLLSPLSMLIGEYMLPLYAIPLRHDGREDEITIL